TGVLVRLHALSPGHAERSHFGMAQSQLARLAKVLEVLGIGKRITALDIVHAQLVKPARDEQLILERKVDALALAAVAQRCIVNANACHDQPATKKALKRCCFRAGTIS